MTVKDLNREQLNELKETYATQLAETEYNANKRSGKKRETFQFVAAQEMELSELCGKLGIELLDGNLELII